LRASKVAFKPKPTSVAQIASKTAAVGSRLERFVGRLRRIETKTDCPTDPAIRFTYVHRQAMYGKLAWRHGAAVRGADKFNWLNLRQQTYLQLKKGTVPFSLFLICLHSGP
jgi:hypothetical protein